MSSCKISSSVVLRIWQYCSSTRLRLRVSVMNINKLQKACIFISADPRPTDSVQRLSGSMVVVLSPEAVSEPTGAVVK